MKSESDDDGEFYMGQGKTEPEEANDSHDMLLVVFYICAVVFFIACGFWFGRTIATLLAFLAHHAKALYLEWRIIP